MTRCLSKPEGEIGWSCVYVCVSRGVVCLSTCCECKTLCHLAALMHKYSYIFMYVRNFGPIAMQVVCVKYSYSSLCT